MAVSAEGEEGKGWGEEIEASVLTTNELCIKLLFLAASP